MSRSIAAQLLLLPSLAQRCIAVLLLLLACGTALWAIGSAAALLDAAKVDLVQSRARLGVLQTVLAHAEAPDATVGDLEPSLSSMPEKASVISARLQERLNALAASHGVVVLSAASLPGHPEFSFPTVGLQVTMVGQYGAVLALQNDLDGSVPIVFAKRSVWSRAGRERRNTNTLAAPLEMQLKLELYTALQPVAQASADQSS